MALKRLGSGSGLIEYGSEKLVVSSFCYLTEFRQSDYTVISFIGQQKRRIKRRWSCRKDLVTEPETLPLLDSLKLSPTGQLLYTRDLTVPYISTDLFGL
jgi:hypothetical protein